MMNNFLRFPVPINAERLNTFMEFLGSEAAKIGDFGEEIGIIELGGGNVGVIGYNTLLVSLIPKNISSEATWVVVGISAHSYDVSPMMLSPEIVFLGSFDNEREAVDVAVSAAGYNPKPDIKIGEKKFYVEENSQVH